MKASRFLSSYLRSSDVTHPQTVTVSSVTTEELGRDDERVEKLVIYFRELDQGVVLGRTTIAQLVNIFGNDDTDTWLGRRVCLYNDPTVLFKGKVTGGLRFRAVEGK